ncbi:hypothetical protein [Parasitella parasitica]|uniref:Uncharacterized protein n=1 Tax=Parasitella parasitica TaxID=35722 RepID=A0A0B7NJM7_9FUNG|nr:hypothetical protein [Parasitella parasitica]
MEAESDDDFQPPIIRRKRSSRENTQQSGSQKRLKGKDKEIVADDNPILNTTTLDDYDYDDFQPPVVKRPDIGESSSSVNPTFFAAESSTRASHTSNNTPNTPSKRVITIKTTIKGIWKYDYRQPLYDLVHTTNLLVTHTYAFTKYIFLKELATDENFAFNELITKDFFVEVFLSLVSAKAGNSERLKDTTKRYRSLIGKHKDAYFEDAKYTPISLAYAQQIALYECAKVQTAYFNNMKAHFGNRLRALINKLFKKKEKVESLTKEMEANNFSIKEIKQAIRKNVYQPCNQVKLAITKKNMPESGLLDDKSVTQLNEFFSMYAVDYTFQKESIFYDVVANPEKHFKAFYKLAQLSEAYEVKPFACFPLRRTFIPCYMTVDSKILNYHILKNKKVLKMDEKFNAWGRVVNLERKAFKSQGCKKTLHFQGTLETDGVGVSILKQNTDTNRKSVMPKKPLEDIDDETKYIEKLEDAELKQTLGKCVLMDPGRRDLLYCMKETSRADKKEIMIFTKNDRSKCSRHFRRLRKLLQPSQIREAETYLSGFATKSVNMEKFVEYIQARASVKDILYEYYGNETAKSITEFYPESQFDFKVDQKCNLYYENLFVAKIRGFYPQPEHEPNDITLKSHMYHTYLQIMLNQKHISERLNSEKRRKIEDLAKAILEQPHESGHKTTISSLLGKLRLLPFRKMKFSTKLFSDNNDRKLVKNIKKKFGADAVLVLGNWSAPNTKYQDPTRNKGLRRMLKKNGFPLYLIDEFRTSSFCPKCESDLEKFKVIPNPRPHNQEKQPKVLCHGLLRCKNMSCLEQQTSEGNQRLWNRDQAAVLNFRKILNCLRETKQRPPLFSREPSKN